MCTVVPWFSQKRFTFTSVKTLHLPEGCRFQGVTLGFETSTVDPRGPY